MTRKFLDTAPNVQDLKIVFVFRTIAAGRRLRRGRGLVTNVKLDIIPRVHQDHERNLLFSQISETSGMSQSVSSELLESSK